MLLESHKAKPGSNDQDISSHEEPYNESPNGSDCFEDDLSGLSEKFDELEDIQLTEIEEAELQNADTCDLHESGHPQMYEKPMI